MANVYEVCFYGGLVLAILLLITAIVMFVVLKIPKVIGELTGKTAKKAMKEMQDGTAKPGSVAKKEQEKYYNMGSGKITAKETISTGHMRKATGNDSTELLDGPAAKEKRTGQIHPQNRLHADVRNRSIADTEETEILGDEAFSDDDTEILGENAYMGDDGATDILSDETDRGDDGATDILSDDSDPDGEGVTEVLGGDPAVEDDGSGLTEALDKYSHSNDATDVLTADADDATDILRADDEDATDVLRADDADDEDATDVLRVDSTHGLESKVKVIYNIVVVHTDETV